MMINGSTSHFLMLLYLFSIKHQSIASDEYGLNGKEDKTAIALNVNININGSKIINNQINVSDEFVDFLLNDLNSVTNKGGTAYVSFSILGNKANDIGGKTGTAQNAGDKNNTSWFVGIDSVSNPKYIVATVVDEGGSGSAVAAPVSRRIIQHLLGYDTTPVEFGEITE